MQTQSNTPQAHTEPTSITVIATHYDGSRGERVAITLSMNLTARQKDFIRDRLLAGDCQEYIHSIRWRDNKTIVVMVKYAAISECARIDVITHTRRIASRAPVSRY